MRLEAGIMNHIGHGSEWQQHGRPLNCGVILDLLLRGDYFNAKIYGGEGRMVSGLHLL